MTTRFRPPTAEQIAQTRAIYDRHPSVEAEIDPRIERLVEDLIGAVADKWTMIVLENLVDGAALRFTELARRIDGISQKMLTQTLRRMERDGLLVRKVYPEVPPKVEYRISDLGLTLSAAFCGVWVWATDNLTKVEAARTRFDRRAKD